MRFSPSIGRVVVDRSGFTWEGWVFRIVLALIGLGSSLVWLPFEAVFAATWAWLLLLT